MEGIREKTIGGRRWQCGYPPATHALDVLLALFDRIAPAIVSLAPLFLGGDEDDAPVAAGPAGAQARRERAQDVGARSSAALGSALAALHLNDGKSVRLIKDILEGVQYSDDGGETWLPARETFDTVFAGPEGLETLFRVVGWSVEANYKGPLVSRLLAGGGGPKMAKTLKSLGLTMS